MAKRKHYEPLLEDDGEHPGFTGVHLAGRHYYMVRNEHVAAVQAAVKKAIDEGANGKEMLKAIHAAVGEAD